MEPIVEASSLSTSGFKYLASPYTDPDPLIREQRYLKTAETVAILLKNGIWTYSPIVHCHEVVKIWDLPHHAEFWKEYDAAMIRASTGLFVLRLEGWAKSAGVRGEIELATQLGLSITYMLSGELDAKATTTIHTDQPKPPTA